MEQSEFKPYHLFYWQDKPCLIHIENMSAYTIEKKLADFLAENADKPITPVDEQVKEDLVRLALLKTKTPTPKARPTVEKEWQPVLNASFFLTQRCNLRCIYCYGDGGSYGSGGDMEEKTALQAVDWLFAQSGKYKKLHIGFFGGEPFLNFPLMQSIVAYAQKKAQERDKTVAFHTTTNGTLLAEEQIAFIKETQLSLLVSFDGDKKRQDMQRPFADGQGSYDVLLPKIKKLLSVVPAVSGHAVLVGDADPRPVKQALSEIGFTEISFSVASPSLFAPTEKPPRDMKRLLNELEKEAEAWLHRVQDRNLAKLQELKASSHLYVALLSLAHNSKKHYGCGAGRGLAAISATGDIYLCHRFVGMPQYKIGNVFHAVCNREAYQTSPLATRTACAACFAKYYCGGGCMHDHAGSSGSIDTPAEEICRLRRREFELAAFVISQLAAADRAFLTEQAIIPSKPCPLDF